jgi:hypothetical protein
MNRFQALVEIIKALPPAHRRAPALLAIALLGTPAAAAAVTGVVVMLR